MIIRAIIIEEAKNNHWEIVDRYFISLYDYAIERAQAINKVKRVPTRVVQVLWESK